MHHRISRRGAGHGLPHASRRGFRRAAVQAVAGIMHAGILAVLLAVDACASLLNACRRGDPLPGRLLGP